MHHVMLLITNFKITSILTCNIKVILIVRFSCRISKCEWNLKCESNNHWTMHYVMLLITNFDITFIFTCKRVVVMCCWPTTKCVSNTQHQQVLVKSEIWIQKLSIMHHVMLCIRNVWYHIHFQVQTNAVIVLLIDNKMRFHRAISAGIFRNNRGK